MNLHDSVSAVTRRAREDDAGPIAEVQAAAWRAAYAGILPAAELDGLDTTALAGFWRTQIAAADEASAHVLVHDDGEGVAGFSAFGPARDDDLRQRPDTEELYAFYARPERWDRGVGRELMRSTLSVWAGKGTRTAYLWVLERNERGRAFYEKGGWRPDPAAAPSGSEPGAMEIRYLLSEPRARRTAAGTGPDFRTKGR
ncbi:GNAT family N-acetyltransferase [Streptomyces roseolilacinus]|uniref:N-acetyltransferase n=1 Tax=Streptomyces roseolilacinus TaxID=66904 RepID=A0A918B064_9ACTN|nr:GNAT family N-acetyltransferase [Streptomyces roseolilacinus]GGQ07051.1 N-acetyltransferase [Streptomyces roseolilacinus]